MKYTIEMGPDAMVYIPISIKIGSGIQTLMVGRIHRHTESMVIAKAYFYFFKIRKVG
jgi:hypothetical protein